MLKENLIFFSLADVCMAPDELLNDADRATKAQLFKTGGATVRTFFSSIFVRRILTLI